jgi:hypothetical protein
LLLGFVLGSAAGGAAPVPAALGSTEAALIGVLVSVHVAAVEAVQVVLIFRLLTFWLWRWSGSSQRGNYAGKARCDAHRSRRSRPPYALRASAEVPQIRCHRTIRVMAPASQR